MHESVAVLGAGPAGLAAALELADSGVPTLLLERDLRVGGRAAEYTCKAGSECARCNVCLVSDLTDRVRAHQLIEPHFGVRPRELRGEVGSFQLNADREGLVLDPARCTGCGLCANECPADESPPVYPSGLAGDRTYRLDPDSCLPDCRVCEDACPTGAIDLGAGEESLRFDFSHLIVATGFRPFPAGTLAEYGYGATPTVLTANDLEDGLRACGDPAEYLGDARRVAFVQCVGSRDEHNNSYCSAVCCAYTMRLARLLREEVPDVQLTLYYMDLQSFGRGWPEFRDRCQELGIEMRRGKPASIQEGADGVAIVQREDPSGGHLCSEDHDLVVLSVGIAPEEDASRLARILRLTRDRDGFFAVQSDEASATETDIPGVFAAGACTGPGDIAHSIAHGRRAALGVKSSLQKGRSS